MSKGSQAVSTARATLLFLGGVVFACICIIPSAGALSSGGPGFALHFDPRRSDIVSFDFSQGPPTINYTCMYSVLCIAAVFPVLPTHCFAVLHLLCSFSSSPLSLMLRFYSFLYRTSCLNPDSNQLTLIIFFSQSVPADIPVEYWVRLHDPLRVQNYVYSTSSFNLDTFVEHAKEIAVSHASYNGLALYLERFVIFLNCFRSVTPFLFLRLCICSLFLSKIPRVTSCLTYISTCIDTLPLTTLSLTVCPTCSHQLFHRGTDSITCTDDACVVPPGVWTHVAYTFTSSGITTYYNGTQVFFANSAAGDLFQTPQETSSVCAMIGQAALLYCNQFSDLLSLGGQIDEFRVWDKVLSPSEITDAMAGSVSTEDDNLFVYYNFDDKETIEATGHIEDLSGNGNTGFAGRISGTKQLMVWTSRDPCSPTRPRSTISSAPLVVRQVRSSNIVIASGISGTNITVELTSYHADDGVTLTHYVSSLPASGSLYQTDGTLISGASHVSPVLVSGGTQVIYVGTFLNGIDSFTYEVHVSDATPTLFNLTAQVIETPVVTPSNTTFELLEDQVKVLVLGDVSATGSSYVVEIASLPSKGRIFHFPSFEGMNYETLFNVQNLTEITTPNVPVLNTPGAVVFVPEADGSSQEEYTSFAFRFVDPENSNLRSSDAFVSVFVSAVNDAPTSPDLTISLNNSISDVLVTLSGTDPDSSFNGGMLAYITSLPKFGTLYQAEAGGSRGALITIDSEPEIGQWVTGVKWATMQWSYCEDCRFDFTCNGRGWTGCDVALEWMAAGILGEYDEYPNYGDLPNAWQPFLPDSDGEYIVLEYTFPVYVSGIEIYEVFHPGCIVKVEASDEWGGSDEETDWELLWEGVPENPPADEAWVFSPPLCPSKRLSQYIRLQVNGSLVPGWSNFDAVRLYGSSKPRPNLVKSESLQVVLAPTQGILPGSAFLAYDSFTYALSDCESTSADITVAMETSFNTTIASIAGEDRSYFSSFPYSGVPGESNSLVLNFTSIVASIKQRVPSAPSSASDYTFTLVDTCDMVYREYFAASDSAGPVLIAPATLTPSAGNVFFLRVTSSTSVGRTVSVLRATTSSGVSVSFSLAYTPDCKHMHKKWPRDTDGVCIPCRSVSSAQLKAMSPVQQVAYYDTCKEEFEKNAIMVGVILALFALVAALGLGFMVFFFLMRQSESIRASSYKFSILVCFMAVVGACVVPVLSLDETQQTCLAMTWLAHLSFSGALAAILIRLVRIADIFGNPVLCQIKSRTDTVELLRWSFLVGLVAVYLTVWTMLDPPQVKEATFFSGKTQVVYKACDGGEWEMWTYIPLTFEMLALIYAVRLAYKIRKAPQLFNDTGEIVITTYGLTFIALISLPVVFTVTEPTAHYVVSSVSILFACITVIGVMFAKRVVHTIHAVQNGGERPGVKYVTYNSAWNKKGGTGNLSVASSSDENVRSSSSSAGTRPRKTPSMKSRDVLPENMASEDPPPAPPSRATTMTSRVSAPTYKHKLCANDSNQQKSAFEIDCSSRPQQKLPPIKKKSPHHYQSNSSSRGSLKVSPAKPAPPAQFASHSESSSLVVDESDLLGAQPQGNKKNARASVSSSTRASQMSLPGTLDM